MGFSVSETSSSSGTSLRSIEWVNTINVETDVDGMGLTILVEVFESLFKDLADSLFGDSIHIIDLNIMLLDHVDFELVHISETDVDDIFALKIGGEPVETGDSSFGDPTEKMTNRHTMIVARGRSFGDVAVTVSINPDDLKVWVSLLHTRDGSSSDTMITTEDEIEVSFFGRFVDGFMKHLVGSTKGGSIHDILVFILFEVGLLDGEVLVLNVTLVLDIPAQVFGNIMETTFSDDIGALFSTVEVLSFVDSNTNDGEVLFRDEVVSCGVHFGLGNDSLFNVNEKLFFI
mmetsp:Transcript_59/g.54  ORF Transcript_59/g.54 Transcript_59/m.54 type:complete len:288 (+) Transcript_59:513-1376(+)